MVTFHFACEWDLHPHHTSQPVVLSLLCLDAFMRHYLNERLPVCCLFCVLFFFSLFDFTTMSVLMMCQWNCPMLGTLAKWWLMGGVDPSIMKKAFVCSACYITSSKAYYSSFSLSYHWFLLINQIPPSTEFSCLCINCNIFFLNLINDWDPAGVHFLIFLF